MCNLRTRMNVRTRIGVKNRADEGRRVLDAAEASE